MTLKERLNEDMKSAMKAREEGKERLSVIRLARAAIKNAEIDRGHELSDEEVLEVLAREVKQRRDAIVEYQKAERPETVAALEREIAIVLGYMPQQMTPDEIRSLVVEIIAQVAAKEAKDIGKVMGALMPKVKGRADGKLVNQIVRETLG
ncbi:MAG TPA: GatB/YqeY domain-containing protein [Bacillota bacterium]